MLWRTILLKSNWELKFDLACGIMCHFKYACLQKKERIKYIIISTLHFRAQLWHTDEVRNGRTKRIRSAIKAGGSKECGDSLRHSFFKPAYVKEEVWLQKSPWCWVLHACGSVAVIPYCSLCSSSWHFLWLWLPCWCHLSACAKGPVHTWYTAQDSCNVWCYFHWKWCDWSRPQPGPGVPALLDRDPSAAG